MIATRYRRCLLAAALLIGACTSDDDPSDVTVAPDETTAPDTTTTTEAPTTTAEDPTAAVEQAFYDQWDAFIEILEDPDPSNPLIDEFFTGEARDSILDTVSTFIESGQTARRPDDTENFQPRVTGIALESETEAVVFECTLDGTVVLGPGGDVVNDTVSTYEARNTFLFEDDQWRLESSGDLREGDPSCDAA